MASERPGAHSEASFDNVIAFPTNRIVRLGPSTNDAERADSDELPLTPITDLFSRVDMDGAMVRHLSDLAATSKFITLKERTAQRDFQEKLSSILLRRRDILLARNKTTPLVVKEQIKAAKHEVLIDLVSTTLHRKALNRSPVINLDNYQIALEGIKAPLDDQTMHILLFYKSLFSTMSGIVSAEVFNKINIFFRDHYWLAVKKTVKSSPEYLAVKSLVGDKLDDNFLQVNIETLNKAEDPVIANFFQYKSIMSFILSLSEKKPNDEHLKREINTADLKQKAFIKRLQNLTDSRTRTVFTVQKQQLLFEIEQEVQHLKSFIQQDILEIKDSSNVILLSTRMDQLRNEKVLINEVEKVLHAEAQKTTKKFIAVLRDLLEFLMTEAISKTPFYRSLSDWSPEILGDFADWLYQIMQESPSNEAIETETKFTATRELFRARVTNILSPKKR